MCISEQPFFPSLSLSFFPSLPSCSRVLLYQTIFTRMAILEHFCSDYDVTVEFSFFFSPRSFNSKDGSVNIIWFLLLLQEHATNDESINSLLYLVSTISGFFFVACLVYLSNEWIDYYSIACYDSLCSVVLSKIVTSLHLPFCVIRIGRFSLNSFLCSL